MLYLFQFFNLSIFQSFNFSIFPLHSLLESLDISARHWQKVVHAQHADAVAVTIAGYFSHIVDVDKKCTMDMHDEIVVF